MHVVGTAGHVDHGKSTLVQALTGINPDRLREELDRQMTIDLGFAWLTLPGGETVGIVDVPGHRDFVENMLAGVAGMDAVLLVVAADEGVMPQTREHLAILSLLGVQRGLVVLTKADLVEDPEWLRMVEADLRALLVDSPLADAPAVSVSARTGAGLDALRQKLADVLRETPVRRDRGRPRLPVDRVFSMSGFGTVVTGTLVDGALEVGQEVEFFPSGQRGRIRGLQSHRNRIEQAEPGSRVAANVSGVDVQAVRRGEVLGNPGSLTASRLLDVKLLCLPDAAGPITHNLELKVFLGTAQRVGRVRLLEGDRIKPGDEAWAQLVLREPAVAGWADRFVVRRPSPGETLGGGVVADPVSRRLHRRRERDTLDQLERKLQGDPEDALLDAARVTGPTTIRALAEAAGLNADAAIASSRRLVDAGRLKDLAPGSIESTPESLVVSVVVWETLTRQAIELLREYHTAHTLRFGVPREELKSRLGLAAKPFAACLDAWIRDGQLQDFQGAVGLAGYAPQPSSAERTRMEQASARVEAARFSPPSSRELVDEVGEEAFAYLVATRAIVPVSADVVFSARAYAEMVDRVQALLAREGEVTVGRIRDEFETSRKYVVALMEHMDSLGLTVRDGDVRRLARRTGRP
ncbi:MAG: selenocysteine-specific translation elongation factor [Chloroflexi bacterium]|nr:selenocysteine-specific translation elongation factor [Chloroflexota bacterium]